MLCGCLGMAAQEKNAERCALLAARGDVEGLRPLYDSVWQTLPPHTEMYCRFAFARAVNDNEQTVRLIDSLETNYADKFDLRGLLALCDVRCEAMRQTGDYVALKKYCKERLDWCYRRGIKISRRENLKFYQQIAERFDASPCTKLEWTSKESIVPVSREWPTMIPVGLAGDSTSEIHVLPFLYAKHQTFTVISEDDALECGVTPIGEPLKIDTNHGKTMARPAMMAHLQLGNLLLHNILVFVVSDNQPAPYNRCVGSDVLSRFRQCIMGDDYLSVSAEGDFLRADHSLRNDSVHTSRRVADYIAKHDILGLLRNEASLQLTASEAELNAMDEAINSYFIALEDTPWPKWLETIVTQEIPDNRQAYRLYNTIDGLVYEYPENGRFKTVILNAENSKDCLVNLQNMMIYR